MFMNDFGLKLNGVDMKISDMIISLHNLAREVSQRDFDEGHKIRLLADELAKIGNTLHEKEMNNA